MYNRGTGLVYEEQSSWGEGCTRNVGVHSGLHETMTIAWGTGRIRYFKLVSYKNPPSPVPPPVPPLRGREGGPVIIVRPPPGRTIMTGPKRKLLKKPLFHKRLRSYNFPPRKTLVDQKQGAISRQEKMAFFSPRRVALGLPSPSLRVYTHAHTDVRREGRTLTSETCPKNTCQNVSYPKSLEIMNFNPLHLPVTWNLEYSPGLCVGLSSHPGEKQNSPPSASL